MATESDIKKIFYDWLFSVLNIDVIWANQPEKGVNDEAPQPVGTYATMEILSGPRREGLLDEERPPDGGGNPSEELIIAGQRLSTLNVEIFGSGAYDYMVAVQDSLQDREILDSLKRKQTTEISVNSPVNPADVYQVTIVGVPITVEAESYLSLDGNGYARGSASGIFNTNFNVYKTRVKPGFSITDGATHTVFDTTTGSRYALSKTSTSNLEIRAGDTVVFSILLANYSGFWNALDWNELIITVDSTGSNHSAVLNGNTLTLTSPVSFTPSAPAEITVGAQFGVQLWVGLIDYLRIFAGATESLALANKTAGYEFANDYTGTPAATLTAQGTGNTFTTEDTPETIRDDFVTAINASAYLDEIIATDGTNTNELVLTGKIGGEFSVTVNGNLTIDGQVNAVDIAIIGDEGMINVAELLETVWEPRQSMDIIFRTHTAIVKLPDYIESAEITGDISGNQITIDVST